MSTIETAFRGRVPLVNLDKGSAIPLRFVCELPHQLRPSDIANSFGKGVVLDHILDLQTLDTYNLVFAYDLGREFASQEHGPEPQAGQGHLGCRMV